MLSKNMLRDILHQKCVKDYFNIFKRKEGYAFTFISKIETFDLIITKFF